MRLLFAVLACGLLLECAASEEVELITEPRPGEEFVLFRASVGSGRSTDVGGVKINKNAAPEPVTSRVHTGNRPLEVLVGAHINSNRNEEVQTEVSVVTSKNVHVDGVTVRPAAASGVHHRNADREEVRIIARKISEIPKKTISSTEKSIDVTEAAASENIEVKSEAEIGVVKAPVSKTERDEISVPPGKFQSSEAEVTTYTPRGVSDLPPPLNVLSTGPHKQSEQGGLVGGKGVISDAPLISAGSQPQSSRINVKKGPNGQDYEYEYVYYYYDDDTDDASNSTSPDVIDSKDDIEDIVVSSSTTTTTTLAPSTTTTSAPITTTTTTPVPPTERPTNGRRYLPTPAEPIESEELEDEEDEADLEPHSRTRGRGWSNARGGNPQHSRDEESEPVRNGGTTGGRVRYTTIDRSRPSVSEEEQPAPTERPAANEVVPVRGGSRFRGRPHTEAPEIEERLPTNTRFPPRRGNATPAPDAPASHPRHAVRPSLELVDSSSFRTGAATPSADLPSFPSVPGGPGAPVRFLGVTAEDISTESTAPPRRRGRPVTTTSTTSPSTTTVSTTEAAPITTEAATTEPALSANSLAVEKAAYDLYAILQQAQDNIQENVVQEDGIESQETTTIPEDTTLPPVTTTNSTPTTTTTTPEPSTEPSTTTSAPTSGRGRYRTRGGSNAASPVQQHQSRSRIRHPEVTNHEVVPEVHQESTTVRQRGRFGASSGRKTTTHSPAREEETNENESPSVTTRPRNRFRAASRTISSNTPAPTQATSASVHHVRPSFPKRHRGPHTSTAAPVVSSAEETHEPSDDEAAAPAAAPAPAAAVVPKSAGKSNSRLRPPVRPLRTGGRISLPRPGALTTPTSPAPATTAAETSQESGITSDTAPASEEVAAAPENIERQDAEEAAITTPPPGTLTRLRNRPRLRITERAPKPQTSTSSQAASPASRRQLVSSLLPRRRPTPAAELEAEPAPIEAETRVREEEEVGAQEAAPAEQAPPTSVPAPTEQESRLSSLLKKRGRKPGLFPSRHATPAPEAV